ncbi:hypothetical protein ACDN41_26875 [Priestia aryabhattai]|uniref:hypothetical protein n=1 Tax=Priestia aryabhattai TaxID=412384 RepID=UPI003531BDA6
MQQYQIENAVITLIYHCRRPHKVNQQIFFKYMENLCDPNNRHYILEDLQLVADILKKYKMPELASVISLFDYKAFQVLDRYMRESR